MAETLPPNLVRHVWNAEVDNHARELIRALELAQQHLAAAQRGIAEGKVDVYELRQLTVEATDAYQRGAALVAIERLRFALPDDTPTT